MNEGINGDSKILVFSNDNQIFECEIKDLKIGDTILTYDPRIKLISTVDIVSRINIIKIENELLKLTLMDDKKIIVTSEYPIFVAGRFNTRIIKKSNLITDLDNIILFKGTSKIKNIEKIQSGLTYSILTKKNHNFFANGICLADV